ncbi:MAG: hypothetical protein U9M98_01860 [Patescibacteria group bacterium]|nr:hypothetical protein [Patescibacteria group bacterium]
MKDAIVGACGICCSACELHEKLGCFCSSGTEKRAKEKVESNWNGKGVLCLVCKCAVERGVSYCPRDCEDFPCEKFREWDFPYGEAYLDMHKRRREEAESGEK